MKTNNAKKINILSGIIFLCLAVYKIGSVIYQVIEDFPVYIDNPIQVIEDYRVYIDNPILLVVVLVLNFCGIIFLTIMGVFALRQKKRGKVLNFLSFIYFFFEVVSISVQYEYDEYGFSAKLLSILAFVFAFMFTWGASFMLTLESSGVYDAKYISSKVAKIQALAEKLHLFMLTQTLSDIYKAAKMQALAEEPTSIYDKQLREGILTQEEYDQIMKSRK